MFNRTIILDPKNDIITKTCSTCGYLVPEWEFSGNNICSKCSKTETETKTETESKVVERTEDENK